MASVKKTMRSSRAKQAKQSGTDKAKASKRSPGSKAKKAAARVLTSKGSPVSRSGRKTSSRGTTAARATAKPAAKELGRKKVTTARSAAQGSSRTAKSATARHTKAPSTVREAARRRPAPKSGSGNLSSKRAAAAKPSEGRTAAATKVKAQAVAAAAERRSAVNAAARKAVEPAAAAMQKSPASRLASAANLTANKEAANKEGAAGPAKIAVQPAAVSSPPAGKNIAVKEVKEHEAVVGKTDKLSTPSLAKASARAGGAPDTAKAAPVSEALPPAKSADQPAVAKVKTDRPPGAQPVLAAGPATPSTGKPAAAEAAPGAKLPGPAHKPAKSEAPQRHLFKVDEFVVYPAHGVGQIIAIEEQEVAGFKLELYVLSFVKDKMILKVPTTKAASAGMRKLADEKAIKSALTTLSGRARIKRTMWSRRAQEYEAKINSGDLNAIAEVVRDLYRSETQPEQSYSERQLYEAALDRLAREIVVVQNLTETESLKMIEAHLRKGPRRRKGEEGQAEEAEAEDSLAEDADIEEAA